MRSFVVDEDLPRSLTLALRELGHTVHDIRDTQLRGQPDELVFAFAQQMNCVLVTGDRGFGNILHFPPGSHQGIVIVALPNSIPIEIRVQKVSRTVGALSPESYRGRLIVIEPSQVRIRPPR